MREELERQKEKTANEKMRYKELWSIYCARSTCDDALIASKEKEVEELQKRLAALVRHSPSIDRAGVSLRVEPGPAGPSPRVGLAVSGTPVSSARPPRKGKAPPIDTFSGDDSNFEDWLPALQRCATSNGWSDDETLLQLAGYLRARALEEWNLMDEKDKTDFGEAVSVFKRPFRYRNVVELLM